MVVLVTMIKKLLFATGNSFKFNLMKKRLEVFDDLELISPKSIGGKIDVVEDGKTAEERWEKEPRGVNSNPGAVHTHWVTLDLSLAVSRPEGPVGLQGWRLGWVLGLPAVEGWC